jgi:hypothetical protein
VGAEPLAAACSTAVGKLANTQPNNPNVSAALLSPISHLLVLFFIYNSSLKKFLPFLFSRKPFAYLSLLTVAYQSTICNR